VCRFCLVFVWVSCVGFTFLYVWFLCLTFVFSVFWDVDWLLVCRFVVGSYELVLVCWCLLAVWYLEIGV